jgi:hypothetical protein|uniref:Uncharacterized protein n=1 Tax=viral metagenome TaxID=1070528 RepID=A0A6C0BMI4_9ZZZZ
MDLNLALQLNRDTQYRDYRDPQVRDHAFNQSVANHVFDRVNCQSQPSLPSTHIRPSDPSRSFSSYDASDQVNSPAFTTATAHGPMSHAYLSMKQAQERETLMESSVANPIAIKQLQMRQVDEIRQLSDQMQRQQSLKYQHLKNTPCTHPEPANHTLHPRSPCQFSRPSSLPYWQNKIPTKSNSVIPLRQISQEIAHRYQQILSSK